jgi:hypothetical protein
MQGSAHLPLAGLNVVGTEAAALHFARPEGGRSIDPLLLTFLHERSAGNPWHIREWLLDHMKHELIVVHGDDQPIETLHSGTGINKLSALKKKAKTRQVGEMYIKVGPHEVHLSPRCLMN